MKSATKQSPGPQLVERTREVTVRRKARQVLRALRERIADEFLVVQSTEDLAEKYGLPARTITDIVLLDGFGRRRGPGIAMNDAWVRKAG